MKRKKLNKSMSAHTNKQSDGYFRHGFTVIKGNDTHSTILKYISIIWPKIIFITLLILFLKHKLQIGPIVMDFVRHMLLHILSG